MKIEYNINYGQGHGGTVEEAKGKLKKGVVAKHLILTAYTSDGAFLGNGNEASVEHLDLSGLKSLETLKIYNAVIEFLDVSKNLKLRQIALLSKNAGIKNGVMNPKIFLNFHSGGLKFKLLEKMIGNFRQNKRQ